MSRRTRNGECLGGQGASPADCPAPKSWGWEFLVEKESILGRFTDFCAIFGGKNGTGKHDQHIFLTHDKLIIMLIAVEIYHDLSHRDGFPLRATQKNDLLVCPEVKAAQAGGAATLPTPGW